MGLGLGWSCSGLRVRVRVRVRVKVRVRARVEFLRARLLVLLPKGQAEQHALVLVEVSEVVDRKVLLHVSGLGEERQVRCAAREAQHP